MERLISFISYAIEGDSNWIGALCGLGFFVGLIAGPCYGFYTAYEDFSAFVWWVWPLVIIGYAIAGAITGIVVGFVGYLAVCFALAIVLLAIGGLIMYQVLVFIGYILDYING